MLTHCVCVYLTMGRSQERQLNLSTSCLEINTNTTLVWKPGGTVESTVELIRTFLTLQRRRSPALPEPAASR